MIPREITSETRRAASLFLEAGIPLLNQSVLLAGGPPLPAYVIDLPDGAGKAPVESLGSHED